MVVPVSRLSKFLPPANPVDLSRMGILYQTRIINADNVDLYRNSMTYGEVSVAAEQIIIYRYRIADGLNLPKNDAVYKRLANVDENRTMAHEKRHCRNYMFNDYYYSTDNVFEVGLLSANDEISAFIAGLLYGRAPRNIMQLHQIASYCIDNFLGKSNYLNRHMRRVDMACDRIFRGPDGVRRIEKLLARKRVSYSKTFDAIIDYYMTFGKYHLVDDDNPMPDELRDGFNKVRKLYEAETRRRLEKFLSNHL